MMTGRTSTSAMRSETMATGTAPSRNTTSALQLNPNNDLAHAGLGLVLAARGDLDGTITEEREALRLNPNNAAVHASLGDALEQKGDRAAALTEYRAAATLDPKNINYKQNCERLMQQSNR